MQLHYNGQAEMSTYNLLQHVLRWWLYHHSFMYMNKTLLYGKATIILNVQ
jgi:hypothetical protein